MPFAALITRIRQTFAGDPMLLAEISEDSFDDNFRGFEVCGLNIAGPRNHERRGVSGR